jgi:hypothetical protein
LGRLDWRRLFTVGVFGRLGRGHLGRRLGRGLLGLGLAAGGGIAGVVGRRRLGHLGLGLGLGVHLGWLVWLIGIWLLIHSHLG